MKINIGRYIQGNSILHRMDARVKFLGNIAFIVLFFLVNTFVLQSFLLLPLLILFVIVSKKPLHLLRMLIMPIYVGLFLLIINMFVLDTSDWTNAGLNHLYWSYKDLVKLDYGIIVTTLSISFRIYAIMLTMILFTLTTPPVLITKALDFYLYPLKLIKIPTHILTTIITIAFRFVPTLIDESSRIFKAQASRGMDFKNGSFKTKVKSIIVLIIPLFVSSFSKADDLANAMETRGYNPYAIRTSYRKWSFNWWDALALLSIIFIIVMVALILSNPNNMFSFPKWWTDSVCSI